MLSEINTCTYMEHILIPSLYRYMRLIFKFATSPPITSSQNSETTKRCSSGREVWFRSQMMRLWGQEKFASSKVTSSSAINRATQLVLHDCTGTRLFRSSACWLPRVWLANALLPNRSTWPLQPSVCEYVNEVNGQRKHTHQAWDKLNRCVKWNPHVHLTKKLIESA